MTGFSMGDVAGPLRSGRAFLFGLVMGLVVAGAGSALWAQEDINRSFVKSTLYALAQLAVDTETVAANLVRLEERVNDLEALLEEESSPRP